MGWFTDGGSVNAGVSLQFFGLKFDIGLKFDNRLFAMVKVTFNTNVWRRVVEIEADSRDEYRELRHRVENKDVESFIILNTLIQNYAL